jgi:excisionase family DNA binding protein
MTRLSTHWPAASLISQQAAAERLSVSVQTISRLIRRKELDAIRVGRNVRVTVESVEQFLSRKGVSQ